MMLSTGKVYTLGESVLDIVFSMGGVKTTTAGGSMLNCAVSLGRVGVPVGLITEFGNDNAGDLIQNFLNHNQVDTQNIHRFEQGKTALALAFLNDDKDAVYDFYKDYPRVRLKVQIPDFQSSDIFLFGSYFSLDFSIRQKVLQIARSAQLSGSLIIYDPNFRKAHANELHVLYRNIMENIEMASIVRASHEDLETIYADNPKGKDLLIEQCLDTDKVLIITNGAQGVELYTKTVQKVYPAKKIKALSTIGAGDNFNAGLIYGLKKYTTSQSSLGSIHEILWKKIMGHAIDFAAHVCKRYDNYVSESFVKKLDQKSGDDFYYRQKWGVSGTTL